MYFPTKKKHRKRHHCGRTPQKCGDYAGRTADESHHLLEACRTQGRHIETALNQWFQRIPRNLFKSITFDCGKEFSNWKPLCNRHDVSINFADPGTPSQRALNENSNGLLRKDGSAKEMDFNQVDQPFISTVADKRNNIQWKSLDYNTPLEAFLSHLNGVDLSNLN